MLKRLLLVGLLGAAGTLHTGESAEANTCRSLEMQLMQAQAARERGAVRRIRGAMVSRGCLSGGDEWQPFARIAPPPRQVMRAVPQRPRRQARPQQARRQEESRPRAERPRMSVARGTFRTLCVRSCDGYYFPISFSTTRERFEADQAACSQLCPQGEASLYYHPSRGEGAESMVALDGSPYVELPTAFSYRSGLNPSCSCGQPSPAAAVAASLSGGAEAKPAEQIAQLPKPRVAPGEDPETLANRDGRFVPEPFASSLVAASEPGGGRAVRTVGVDEPLPVVVSSVPNDFPFDLGLLAEAPGSGRTEAASGAGPSGAAATGSDLQP
jgi:hypothetical protein